MDSLTDNSIKDFTCSSVISILSISPFVFGVETL